MTESPQAGNLRSSCRSRSSWLCCSTVVNPTMSGRHIVVRQQLSPLPQDATLEDEGLATLVYAEQTSMMHNFTQEETARSMWAPIDSCGFRITQALSVVLFHYLPPSDVVGCRTALQTSKLPAVFILKL